MVPAIACGISCRYTVGRCHINSNCLVAPGTSSGWRGPVEGISKTVTHSNPAHHTSNRHRTLYIVQPQKSASSITIPEFCITSEQRYCEYDK